VTIDGRRARFVGAGALMIGCAFSALVLDFANVLRT
jgi:hypothetical protein